MGRSFVDNCLKYCTRLIPCAITVSALYMGLLALYCTLMSYWSMAVLFVLLAALLDAMDGRVARSMGCTSMLGAQLDSLADFFNFGFVPIFIFYYFLFKGLWLGWFAVMLFVSCMAVRLARFNANMVTGGENNPAWSEDYFLGVPAPASAILILWPVVMAYICPYLLKVMYGNILLLPYVIMVAVLTVSKVPTISLKNVVISRSKMLIGLVFCAVYVFLMPFSIDLHTWIFISIFSVGYILSIPIGVFRYRRYKIKGV